MEMSPQSSRFTKTKGWGHSGPGAPDQGAKLKNISKKNLPTAKKP